MRSLFILLLLGILTGRTLCRPQALQNVEESEGDEAEYESEGGEADDAVGDDDEESRISPQDSAVEEQEENAGSGQSTRLLESTSNTDQQRMEGQPTNTNDNLSRYNPNKNNEDDVIDKIKTNDEYQSPSEQRGSSRFLAKSFVDQPDKPFSNRDDTYKSLHNQKNPIDKRTLQSETGSNEDGDLLFERNGLQSRQDRTDNNGYLRSADTSLKFHNSRQSNDPVHESVPYLNKYSKINLERDRRDIQDTKETIQDISAVSSYEIMNEAAAGAAAAANAAAATDAAATNAASVNSDANIADDEESAIKRHVKKLSAEELKELLNSLSEDKRELLIKIMENDDDYNNDINKREITKKAGAAPDDNSFVESGQSDASKLQESCAVSDANLQSSGTESTEIVSSKQQNAQSSSINVLPVTTKSSDASNDSSFSSLFTDKKVEMPNTMDANNLAGIQSYNPTPELKTSKRETDPDQVSNIESSFYDDDDEKFVDSDGSLNEYSNFGRLDKDLSEFDDDQSETELYNKDGNSVKREACEKSDEAVDSIKSLEDSFPNSNSYDDNDSDLAPLVRVKRKNLDSSANKRSADFMSDSKVAYLPYRTENEDEDNDEGSEFDDDGFYDRTSNLAKSVVKGTISDDNALNNVQVDSLQQKIGSMDSQSNLVNPSKLSNKLESDTARVGSDTDSVLSGGEGIDENLMFNSAFRNIRTLSNAEYSSAGGEAAEEPAGEHNRPARSTVLDEELAVTQNYNNNPNYHEKDSLNPFPRNYEGDLGRYKRIRRVKPPVSVETQDL